jgi:hypothetical protein
MTILQNMMLENELVDMKNTILALRKTYKTQAKKLNEGVMDFESDDLDYMFDEAKKRFQAAQRAIKIANKLGDPEQKSRVFSNFNRLRAFVARLTKTIQNDLEEMQQQLKGQQGGTFGQRPVGRTPAQFGQNQQQPQQQTQQRPMPQRPMPQQ